MANNQYFQIDYSSSGFFSYDCFIPLFLFGKLSIYASDLIKMYLKIVVCDNVILHFFQNVIRNQHQSQVKRINDLLRYFEETRYRIDRINSRGYRRYGSDLALDSAAERRGSAHSLDRSDRPGSFRDDRSSHRSKSYRTDSPVDRDYGSMGDGDM